MAVYALVLLGMNVYAGNILLTNMCLLPFTQRKRMTNVNGFLYR